MYLNKAIYTFIILTLPLFSLCQETKEVNKSEREFALKVVKSIIERDCETYYNSINDSVVLYLRIEDAFMAKSDIQDKLKMLCRISVKNDTLNYSYYLENFNLQFFDAQTFSNVEFYGSGDETSTLGSLNFYKIMEGDILFFGAEHKTRNGMDLMLDDAFKFIFRKVNNEYKIILMLN